MSTVGASPSLGGLVDLDVLDNEVGSVETLNVCVGLGVLEEIDQKVGRLNGPPGLANTPLLSCRNEKSSAFPVRSQLQCQ